MLIVCFLLSLLLAVKAEMWYKETSGHDPKDSQNGYINVWHNYFTDFYLCSERKYKVHYLIEKAWSKEFTSCQPAGKGVFIDAIAISGGLNYSIICGEEIVESWEEEVNKYDINNSDGYAGIFGKPIDGFYVFGDEIYNAAFNLGSSTNENEVAHRIIRNLFFKDDYYFNNDTETEIDFEDNPNIRMTGLLLDSSKIKLKGNVMLKIEKGDKLYTNYKGLRTDNLNKHLNKTTKLNMYYIDLIEKFFEKNIKDTGLRYGIISINFDWSHNVIEIYINSKLNDEFYAFRGVARINIYLKDEDLNLLSMVGEICKSLLKYYGKKIPKDIKELLSNLDSFKKFEPILNLIDSYSVVTEEIIFYAILSTIINLDN